MVETFAISANETLFVLPRGGELFTQPITRMDNECAAKLVQCKQIWPEENADAVDSVLRFRRQNPETTLWIACETAFFADLPAAQQAYALPAEERTQGYKRFGADGVFHAWTARQNPQADKLISVHLCGSTNLAAIRAGEAVDTTSGYSLLEGLPGLTTCGDLDPSIVGLFNEEGLSQEEIRQLLYKKSGWQALAENITFSKLCNSTSADLSLPRAMYFHDLIKAIGAMLSSLGGADLIYFGCDDLLNCEALFQELRAHFAFCKIKFQLCEVNRTEVLQEAFISGCKQI
jgi:acetate kinase